MKAATPDKSTQQTEDKKKRKKRQEEASRLPARHTETANAQTQAPGAPTSGNAEGPARQDAVSRNGVPAVHGTQTAYSQGAGLMYQKLQESLELTGDLSHPDTRKKEMDYKMTLGIDELRDYHSLKPASTKPENTPQTVDTQTAPAPKPESVQAKPADTPPVTIKPIPAPAAPEKAADGVQDKPADVPAVATPATAEPAVEKQADTKGQAADTASAAITAAPETAPASLPATPQAPAAAPAPAPQVKTTDNADTAPAAGEAASEEAPAPQTAAENPAFVSLQGQIGTTARAQKQHELASKSSQDAQAAAQSPANERESRAQAGQVEQMDAQQPGEFDAASFRAELMRKIGQMKLPEDEEHAAEFDKNNNIRQVNDSAMVSVKAEKNEAAGNIAEATAKKPDISRQPVRHPAKMPSAPYGKAPATPDATKAMPVKRNESAVEQPAKEQAEHLDDGMKENGITDSMLANSNEPSFTKALNDKNKAKADTQASAVQFRKDENSELAQTRSQAQQQVNTQVPGMHTGRKSGLDKAHASQAETAGKDTAKRKEIADRVNSIYKTSKTEVDNILKNLDVVVAYKFAMGARAAKAAFENHVAARMKAYKKERYGEWYSWKNIKRVKDAFGLPKEVNQFFVTGRAAYIRTLNDYITDIANFVAAQLKAAKARIAVGRKGVSDYVDSLSPALKKLGAEAITAIQGKFSALEQSVNNKKDALIEVLAKKYTENVKALDKRIDQMKKANAGIMGLISDAIMSVVGVIIDLKNKLMSLLAKVGDVVMSIITDPIGFFKNLIEGVGQGVSNFATNIWTHLKTGFFGWLTGAMQGVSFTMPEDAFSLKGIFSIAMQVLGIGWDGIRAIGSAVVGEPVMKALEAGVEIVQVVKKDGIAGLWEYLKDQFQDLKSTIMDSIMDIIQNQVIQAGIKWILGLLSPVGAFVKAIMAIIDVVKFFVQRAAQIAELISAFMESISAIAAGKVGAVAKSIENALGKAIPVLIGLLASILGISGLADKVLGVIRKIRDRITKGITKFWNFVKEKGKALLGKGGIGKKDKKKANDNKDAQDWDDVRVPFDAEDKKTHNLYFDHKGGQTVLMVASTPQIFSDFVADIKINNNDVRTVKAQKSAIRIAADIDKRKGDQTGGDNAKEIRKANDIASMTKALSKFVGILFGRNNDGRIAPKEIMFNLPKNPATGDEFKRQIAIQERELNLMLVKDWLSNRYAFIRRANTTGEGRDPKGDKEIAELRIFIRKAIADNYRKLNARRLAASGLTGDEIAEMAKQHALSVFGSDKVVLHNPDQIAGGDPLVKQKYLTLTQIINEKTLDGHQMIGDRDANSFYWISMGETRANRRTTCTRERAVPVSFR